MSPGTLSTDGEMNEGVIKFRCEWTRSPFVVDPGVLDRIRLWRSRLRGVGFLGACPDGTGFGNLSVRMEGGTFLITGSGTGGLPELDSSHLALVTRCSLEANLVACRGLTPASSESMSHAAVYRVRPDVGAVIHFHSEKLWQECRYTLPTTDPSLEYGTPELALGLQQLVRGLDREVVQSVVMGGHKDGLLTFGPDLDGAGGAALELAGRIRG